MTSRAPTFVIWDVTYACPLRCGHCYSESGRRAARVLDDERFLRATDALIAAGVRCVAFSGGEPLLVPALLPAAARLRDAGVVTHLYTSGSGLDEGRARELVRVFRRIHVSVDGAVATTHDRIRGRVGSFDRAMTALGHLVAASRGTRARVGLEMSVIRSNLGELHTLARLVAERLRGLDFVTVGATVPSGLANRPSFAEAELLDDTGLAVLRDVDLHRELRRVVPPSTTLSVTDNWSLLPLDLDGEIPAQLEPDGAVRAFPIYEGTVGNVLDEPLDAIWARARARHRDRFVVETLSGVSTMQAWAVAARAIDTRFGAPDDLARIRRRTAWAG